jgi:dCMP deaminase
VPVIHQGYLELFRRYAGKELYILGESFLNGFPKIVRDMRAVSPKEAALMARTLGLFLGVRVLETDHLATLHLVHEIIMPDEEISRAVAEQYFSDRTVTFEQIFLRWDKSAMAKVSKINPDHEVSWEQFHRDVLSKSYDEARRSSDWWRQVGAVAIRDGNILFSAHNAHMPSEHTPYIVGDPRSSFDAGEHIELSSALHGEIGIIALAAQRGVALEGADLYVTTFPCSGCARAVAVAKFKRLFYCEGYSQIEGEETLRSNNVEIIRVKMTKSSL